MSGFPRPSRVAAVPLRELAATARASTPLTDTPAGDTPVGDAPVGDTPVTGVTHDSGAVRPGDLYAALAGARHHGVEFLDLARAAGAVAVLTDPAGFGRVPADVPTIVTDDPLAVIGDVA